MVELVGVETLSASSWPTPALREGRSIPHGFQLQPKHAATDREPAPWTLHPGEHQGEHDQADDDDNDNDGVH